MGGVSVYPFRWGFLLGSGFAVACSQDKVRYLKEGTIIVTNHCRAPLGRTSPLTGACLGGDRPTGACPHLRAGGDVGFPLSFLELSSHQQIDEITSIH